MGKIRWISFFIVALSIVLIVKACGQKHQGSKKQFLAVNYEKIPYNFDQPEKKFELKGTLREVSALTYYRKNRLLCVNDEKGLIFEYSLKKGEIKQSYKFGKSGDYEGVELVDSVVYVLRSDGKLFAIRDFKSSEPDVWEYKTPLKARNDTEGLGYDATTGELLIACKSRPGIKGQYTEHRTVYAFHPQKQQLDSIPRIKVSLEYLRKVLNFTGYARFSIKLLKSVNPVEGDITFQPSAIAQHPLTGNIYLLGSVGKLMLVLNKKGDILAVQKLNRKIFKQPEGLCFAPDGTMYISNEGKGGRANILTFKYLNQ